jgi:hypothetical protein
VIYVLLRDGTMIEVRDADTAAELDGEVNCFDEKGFLVAWFPSNTITAYGKHEAMVQYRDEQPQQAGVDNAVT